MLKEHCLQLNAMGMHVFMSAIYALQLDLLFLLTTDGADYRTECNIIAANYSSVEYFIASSKPCK